MEFSEAFRVALLLFAHLSQYVAAPPFSALAQAAMRREFEGLRRNQPILVVASAAMRGITVDGKADASAPE